MGRYSRLERLYKRIFKYETNKEKDYWQYFTARRNEFYLPKHHERMAFGKLLNKQMGLDFCDFFDSLNLEKSKFNIKPTVINKNVSKIKKTGYSKLSGVLIKDNVDSIIKSISNLKLINRKDNSFITYKEFLKGAKKSKTGTFTLINQHLALKKKEIIDLSLDPFLLSVAAKYLNTIPILTQANVLLTLPPYHNNFTSSELNAYAQEFHQDNEYFSFLKVFIYLTDVAENNGPHVYVLESHKKQLIDYKIPFSKRINDQAIKRIYGEDKINKVLGKKGTTIFGDTHCAHKGTTPKNGHRLMIQLEYASTLYGSDTPPFDLSYSGNLYKKFPRLFENFNQYRSKRFKNNKKKISNISKIKLKIIEILYLNKIYPPIFFKSKIR